MATNVKRQLAVCCGLSAVCAFAGNHVGDALDRAAAGQSNIAEVMSSLSDAVAAGCQSIVDRPLDIGMGSWARIGSLLGFVVPFCVWILVQQSMRKSERDGEQHGSSVWAQQKELMEFGSAGNPDPYNRLILSQHYSLAISRDGFDQIHDRNLNVCVIGGSGSGKTRYFVKPNLLQQSFNYFVTDPKYTLPRETLHLFMDQGWDFAIFNTNQVDQSMVYNPFAYLHTDLQISEFVDAFLAMTKDQSKSGGDQFWDDSTNLLLCALIGYCRDWVPPENNNFRYLLYLLDCAQVKENDENFESDLDLMFKEIETGWRQPSGPAPTAGDPQAQSRVVPTGKIPPRGRPSELINNTTHLMPGQYRRDSNGRLRRGLTPAEDFSLALYKKFKTAAGKTLKSILISVNVKLKAIATNEVLDLVGGPDELHLEKLADPSCKYIIFDSFKDVNTQTLGFLHGLLVWQTMQVCVNAADAGTGKLKRPVQFILDEFKSLNLPKSIADMISVVRSRNIGMCIILQSLEQLYQMYDEHCANGIIGCCDTTVYLGGGDQATNKNISDVIGQQTLNQTTTSVSHQGVAGGSWSQNSQTLGRALIDPAEVGKLSRDECLVVIKGTDSAKDKKFDVEHHPYYRLIDPPDITYHKPVVFKGRDPYAGWDVGGKREAGPLPGGRRLPAPPRKRTVPATYNEAVDLTQFFADLRRKRAEAAAALGAEERDAVPDEAVARARERQLRRAAERQRRPRVKPDEGPACPQRTPAASSAPATAT